jgi:PAS domain S-box-containing protein
MFSGEKLRKAQRAKANELCNSKTGLVDKVAPDMSGTLPVATNESVPLANYDDLLWKFRAVFWEADPVTWKFYYVSEYAELLFGYPRRRWLEEKDFWVRVLHPEDREYAVHYCREATSQGCDHCFDYRIVAADGRAVWVRDIVRVECDGFSKVPRRLYGLFIDITEQKELELQHQRERLKLECILDQFPGVVWTTNTELRFTSSRGRYLAKLHLQPDQVIGHTLYEYFATADDDFFPIAMHQRALKGETVSYEFSWQGRLYHVVLQPEREREQIVGVLGFALDITEQHAESRMLREKISGEKRLTILVKRCERLLREIGRATTNADRYSLAVQGLVQIFGCESAAIIQYRRGEVHVCSEAGTPVRWNPDWLERTYQNRRKRFLTIRWPPSSEGRLTIIGLRRTEQLFLALVHPTWSRVHPCIRRLICMLANFLSVFPQDHSLPLPLISPTEQERSEEDISQHCHPDHENKHGEASSNPGTQAICSG